MQNDNTNKINERKTYLEIRWNYIKMQRKYITGLFLQYDL